MYKFTDIIDVLLLLVICSIAIPLYASIQGWAKQIKDLKSDIMTAADIIDTETASVEKKVLELRELQYLNQLDLQEVILLV